MRLRSERHNFVLEERYSYNVLIYYFKELDEDLFKLVSEKINEVKFDSKTVKELYEIFKNKVTEKLSEKFSYLTTKYKNLHLHLYQPYMITAVILNEKFDVSPEEAVYKIVHNKEYKDKFWIFSWEPVDMDDTDSSVVLILSIEYLKQLGYKGEIKNMGIYVDVRKYYERYKRWLKNFKIVTKEQFDDPDFDLTFMSEQEK